MDVSSANDALTLITKIIALGKNATHVEFQEVLMAARQEILSYKEQNMNLGEQLISLSDHNKYQPEKGHAWLINTEDADGPKYCSSCYSAEKRLMPLTGKLCTKCKVRFK